tara:strand:+ start:1776 stop:2351 length:576 start_codon:yes stop_codon:yes gene_type:complete
MLILKNIFLLIFFLISFFSTKINSEMLILDKLQTPGITTQNQYWSFFTDGVMGGFSEGSVKIDKVNNTSCYRMIGNVTTKNNGGFIQIRSLINPSINILDYKGIYLKVFGNNKKYYLHIRTQYTIAPWQYYSHSFNSISDWTEIKLSFSNFKKSNFYQSKKLINQSIKSIGLVAGFDNFDADICLAEIGFY